MSVLVNGTVKYGCVTPHCPGNRTEQRPTTLLYTTSQMEAPTLGCGWCMKKMVILA
jgi:hypothetical protein